MATKFFLCAMFLAMHFRCIVSLSHPDKFQEKNYYCAFFMEEETEVQEGPLNCPRSHHWDVLELGL